MVAEAHIDIPEFMEVIVGEGATADAHARAVRDVRALDDAMQAIYADALLRYRATLRTRHPIILALFTGGGGALTLYPAGGEPVTAPDPPRVYELVKAIAHSAMAAFQLTAPYLREPGDGGLWRAPMQAYRERVAAALPGLGELGLEEADRAALAAILEHNLAYLDAALATGDLGYAGLERFARGQTPLLRRAIAIAAQAQVHHWTGVLQDWRRQLGSDWERVYAATNTLYMTRTGNTLFELLAQEMGAAAIDDRLFLFETLDYTTEPDKMLEMLTRVVADRALGKVFFKDYYLMDVELFSSAVQDAIKAEAATAGREPVLPGLAPFHTHAWPWTTDPTSGSGPATMEEALRQP